MSADEDRLGVSDRIGSVSCPACGANLCWLRDEPRSNVPQLLKQAADPDVFGPSFLDDWRIKIPLRCDFGHNFEVVIDGGFGWGQVTVAIWDPKEPRPRDGEPRTLGQRPRKPDDYPGTHGKFAGKDKLPK